MEIIRKNPLFDERFRLNITDDERLNFPDGRALVEWNGRIYETDIDNLSFERIYRPVKNQYHGFYNLSVHSEYSTFGTGSPEKWIEKIKYYKQNYIGVTEDNLSSVVVFWDLCKKNDIYLIIGRDYGDFILYCQNEDGWKNLVEYENTGKLNLYRLIVVARKKPDFFREGFDYTVEELNLHSSYYIEEEDRFVLRYVMDLAGQTRRTDDMTHLLESGVVNKKLIGFIDRCYWNVDFESQMPIYSPPNDRSTSNIDNSPSKDNVSLQEEFEEILDIGIRKRNIPKTKEYEDRLVYEYNVIEEKNFLDYIMIVWDMVNYCKKNKILVGTGRGSVCGSLLCYIIGIHNVDPIKHGLLFERFINPKVDSFPDIDVDAQSERREEVKNYMKERWNNFYSIGTYMRYKMKTLLKDLLRGKYPFAKLNSITTAIPEKEVSTWTDLFRYAAKTPEFKKIVQDNITEMEAIRVLLNKPKSKSIHPSACLLLNKF